MSSVMRFKVMGLEEMARGESVFVEEKSPGQSAGHPTSPGQEEQGHQWAGGQPGT